MSKPEVVFFDAGLVLLKPDGERLAQSLGLALGRELSRATCERAYRQTVCARDALHLSSADPDWWWPKWCEFAGLAPECVPVVQKVVQELESRPPRLWNVVEDGAPMMLREIVELGVRVGIVSNSDGHLVEDFRLAGLDDFVSGYFDSVVLDVEKPDRRIFEQALREFGVSPERAWFVGDDQTMDVRPARALGFAEVIHFDPLGLYRPSDAWQTCARLSEVARLLETRSQ